MSQQVILEYVSPRKTLELDGREIIDLLDSASGVTPMQDVRMLIHRSDGRTGKAIVRLRLDAPIEAKYCGHAGTPPYAPGAS